jgi:hypothetical protein
VGVKVREVEGIWRVVVHWQGHRCSRNVGRGKGGKRAATAAAQQIHAKLVQGDWSVLDAPSVPPFPSRSARRFAPSPPWTTYFVADGTERVKIGRARNVAARIRRLTTSTGRTLSLLGTIPGDVERDWHARWRAGRILGEWFTLTPDLAQALRAALGLPGPEDPATTSDPEAVP